MLILSMASITWCPDSGKQKKSVRHRVAENFEMKVVFYSKI